MLRVGPSRPMDGDFWQGKLPIYGHIHTYIKYNILN